MVPRRVKTERLDDLRPKMQKNKKRGGADCLLYSMTFSFDDRLKLTTGKNDSIDKSIRKL